MNFYNIIIRKYFFSKKKYNKKKFGFEKIAKRQALWIDNLLGSANSTGLFNNGKRYDHFCWW